jgi:acetyl esterase/lipase
MNRPLRRLAAAALLLAVTALVGCGDSSSSPPATTPASVPAATEPQASDAGFEVETDVSYAAPVGRAHLMDVYVPTSGTGPFPVIMYQAGSAFMSDDTKSPGSGPQGLGGGTSAQALAERWASEGYVIVGFNTRSSSQATFPAQLHDVKAAIRHLRANADRYRIDPAHIGIMGTSSGGWTASMAGVTGDVPSLEGSLGNGDESSAVQAVADLFGPTEFLTMDAQRVSGGQEHDAADSPESMLIGCALQSCKAKARAASPVTYVTEDDPPFYISHGADDPLVPSRQSTALFTELAKVCGDARLTIVPGYGHSDEYLASADASPDRRVSTTSDCKTTTGTTPAPTYATLLAFFDRTLKGT